jgi:hypothetical protein
MKITKFNTFKFNTFKFKIYRKRNFGCVVTDSNVSLMSPKISVELSEVSVDFSERNASVAKTRNFELLCNYQFTFDFTFDLPTTPKRDVFCMYFKPCTISLCTIKSILILY